MKNWIPIKQDYIIDNFENLLAALAEDDFEIREEGLLTESIEKLEEVADNLLNNFFSHKLGILNVDDETFTKNIRMVLASIAASHKIGRPVGQNIALLLDALVINDFFSDEDSLNKIKQIIINLAKDNKIETLPYNLKNLEFEKFDFPLFKQKLLGFKFEDNNIDKVCYESKGCFLIENDSIRILPSAAARNSNKKLKTIVELGFDITLSDEEKKIISDMDFKDQVGILNRVSQSFSKTKPKLPKTLKTYTDEQSFFVKVVDINPTRNWVTCRTIDPAYEPLELYLDLLVHLNLNSYVTLTRLDFIHNIKTGQILKVRLSEKEGKRYFNLNDQVKEFYRDPDNFRDNYAAVFVTEYQGGTRWITELGHVVNIQGNDWDEEIREAAVMDCDKAIEITGINSATDRSGNTVMNAYRTGDLYTDENHDEFKNGIAGSLIWELFSHWESECPVFDEPKDEIVSISPVYVTVIAHLLSAVSQNSSLTFFERYYNSFGAKLLSTITESQHDEIYCEYELAYLRALWAFAQDPGHEWHSLPEIPENLTDAATAQSYRSIIEILNSYDHEKHGSISYDAVNADLVDIKRLRKLVDASNALTGNISSSEINRIKRTISECLGIQHLYREDTSEKYWFGDESEMLEFKTSIVYPPVKNGEHTANPDIQIWQIIKTVNGFLNTLHGGTLQIGVNDFGNAIGVDSDIDWLFRNHHILSPSIDQYLLYIKLRLGNAFKACRRKDENEEITAARLRYSVSQFDGNSVLRIDIMPYEYGCVKIKDRLELPNGKEIKRPQFIKESYIRTANTTTELTEGLRKKIEGDKRNIIKDSERQKYILTQEAIESSNYITLKNYQSFSGMSNKLIEPIELLPLRGLVVGKPRYENKLKVFKLGRCSEVEMSDEGFKPKKHKYSVDPFNMLSTENDTINIQLKLDRLGYLLIKETHPYTVNFISEGDVNDKDFPFRLECAVSDIKGIGSFCLSILGHFKTIDSKILDDYIQARFDEYKQGLS